MGRLLWDKTDSRFYEAGVSHGVLFVKNEDGYLPGIVWNGLTAVNENPSGAEVSFQFADNVKYLNLISKENFQATVEAFTYPDEFEICDGSAALRTGARITSQRRSRFGFSYQTKQGDDKVGLDYNFKIHLIYNALASPTDRSRSTMNDSPEAINFSWEFSAEAEKAPNYKSSAHVILDTKKILSMEYGPERFDLLLTALYGLNGEQVTHETINPTLLLPEDLLYMFGVTASSNAIFGDEVYY